MIEQKQTSLSFSRAIVRTPSRSMVNGITGADLGAPDYSLALAQHAAYIQALQSCGLEVTVLPADERYPDSTFVEDTALLTPAGAFLTRPGADSRRGETAAIKETLLKFYPTVDEIVAPGTVDAGDIMMVGAHFYIGLSARTNPAGAQQIIALLEKHGYSGSTVRVGDTLHLKTGVVYLENNTIAGIGELLKKPEFKQFRQLHIDKDESYAANSLWLNGVVLVAAGYPKALKTIQQAGYQTVELEMSEFRKLDGGLSCLSLRF